jgi:hypothetical protein
LKEFWSPGDGMGILEFGARKDIVERCLDGSGTV